MALSRITDDVLFVIVDALQIEDIIPLGATGRRLRTVTTNERRVWAPRLLTKELGLGTSGLDHATCARLTSLGCTPRRLCLQSLPWRVVRGGSGELGRKGKAYSWRPRDDVPASLLLSAAQDFLFCEVYDSSGPPTYFSDGFARKIVRLEDCDLTHFPEAFPRGIRIPLDIPAAGHPNRDPWYEVRLFVVVYGVLAPMGDTGYCDGEENSRWQVWNSGLSPVDDWGKTWIKVSTDFHIDTYEGGDEDGDAMNFQSLRIEFNECEEDWRGREIEERVDQSSFLRTPVLDPKVWFRRHFEYHAIRAQPTFLFATDSMPLLPFSPDGRSREAELRAVAREAEVAALSAAAGAAKACAEIAEATLKVARAEQAVLAAELGKMKAELGRSLDECSPLGQSMTVIIIIIIATKTLINKTNHDAASRHVTSAFAVAATQITHPTHMHARSSRRARGVAATARCAHGPTTSASGAQAKAPNKETTWSRRCRNANASNASTPTSASRGSALHHPWRPRDTKSLTGNNWRGNVTKTTRTYAKRTSPPGHHVCGSDSATMTSTRLPNASAHAIPNKA